MRWPSVRPLPGSGLVARAGDLLLVCADEPAADALLALLEQVATAGGDGAELVRRIAELVSAAPVTACAAAGPVGDDAVLMAYGTATATADSRDGPVELAAGERLVGGPVTSVRLARSTASPDVEPDTRTRLDSGVVSGGGLVTAPFVASLLIPGPADPVPPEPVDPRPLVEGVDCKNGHFNDPAVPYCQVCGISMAQLTHVSRLGPRPSLGVLLLDNGTVYRLDADYVVGREPQRDPLVAEGKARPLPLGDDDGGISRRHVRVALVGWAVHLVDLGSANGTVVQQPGGRSELMVPGQPVEIRPGARFAVGRRWLRYESHRNPG